MLSSNLSQLFKWRVCLSNRSVQRQGIPFILTLLTHKDMNFVAIWDAQSANLKDSTQREVSMGNLASLDAISICPGSCYIRHSTCHPFALVF